MNVLAGAFQEKATYLNIAGAERPLASPVSPDVVARARLYRLGRVRDQIARNDCAAILLYDPINIRYATDVANMQVWTLHNAARYTLIFADGPCIAFEYRGAEFLARDRPVDEIRPAISWYYFATAERTDEYLKLWGDEVESLLVQHGGGNRRLAVDKCDPPGTELLLSKGFDLVNGQQLMEHARAVKSVDELEMMAWTVQVCDAALHKMHEASEPGRTENEIWSELHRENIRNGGEWIETRLLATGTRTNPWFQECSDKVALKGEILGVDTDMIGPYGYCADVSRSWTIGHVPMTARQADLYKYAREQIDHNMALLRPGLDFRDFVEKSWQTPERFRVRRYSCALHGVGLCDEFPSLPLREDVATDFYGGVFEENMVIAVESLIGEEGGEECVKLETQVIISRDGPVRMDSYPWEDER
jgi:Xaa-Pro aminopeptidase